MKKKLGYLFVTICIALLVSYLFRYKQASVLEGKVPRTATEIVHLDLRQLEHHLLIDAIKNPLRYISFKSKKKGAVSLRKTVVIPQNLLIYTNTTSLKDAWFSSFITVKDEAKLKSYLLYKGFEEFTAETLELFKKDKIVIAISKGRLVIAYNTRDDSSIASTIQSVFEETSFYEKDDDLLRSISNLNSGVSYVNVDASFLEADFKNGLFEIKGTVKSNLFKANSNATEVENSIGFMAVEVNKDHPVFISLISDENKTKFKEFTKLSMDSIVHKWNGNIALNLKTINKKIDTIITYEYDDDFNKIEKKSVQERIVPDISIALGSQADLYQYFDRNNAIQTVEEDTLFTSIPLYKMYAKRQPDGLRIFTKKEGNMTAAKEAQYKINAHIDLQKYLETPLEFSALSSKNENLQFVKNASAELTTNDELMIQVRTKEDSRNFLAQFVKPN